MLLHSDLLNIRRIFLRIYHIETTSIDKEPNKLLLINVNIKERIGQDNQEKVTNEVLCKTLFNEV